MNRQKFRRRLQSSPFSYYTQNEIIMGDFQLSNHIATQIAPKSIDEVLVCHSAPGARGPAVLTTPYHPSLAASLAGSASTCSSSDSSHANCCSPADVSTSISESTSSSESPSLCRHSLSQLHPDQLYPPTLRPDTPPKAPPPTPSSFSGSLFPRAIHSNLIHSSQPVPQLVDQKTSIAPPVSHTRTIQNGNRLTLIDEADIPVALPRQLARKTPSSSTSTHYPPTSSDSGGSSDSKRIVIGRLFS